MVLFVLSLFGSSLSGLHRTNTYPVTLYITSLVTL